MSLTCILNSALVFYFQFTLFTILLVDNFRVKVEINLVEKILLYNKQISCDENKTKVKSLRIHKNYSEVNTFLVPIREEILILLCFMYHTLR